MIRTRRFATVIAALMAVIAAPLLTGVSGCRGVPLSTMWKMRSFSMDDFADLDASHIEVGLQVDDSIEIPADSTILRITLQGDEQGDRARFEFPLRIKQRGRTVGLDLPRATQGRQWYRFDVAPEEHATFTAMQDHIRSRGETKTDVTVDVATGLGATPSGKNRLEIRLQLDRREGFFTLFDGVVEAPAE